MWNFFLLFNHHNSNHQRLFCTYKKKVDTIIEWYLKFHLHMYLFKVVGLIPGDGEVCLIQFYVIEFVIDLRHVCGLLWALLFSPLIKRMTKI